MNIQRLQVCTGHSGALYTLAPGRDARHVLSAGGDGWIVEWNLDQPETGQLVASVETQIFSLCCIPEQGRIIAGNMNGGLHWIDRNAPDQTRNLQHHKKGVYSLLAAGDRLFSAGGDGVLTRWSLEQARSLESYQLSNQALRALAYAPTRGELAVAASDHSIYLLDFETLAIRHVIKEAHTNSVFTVAYTPGERYLFSGGRDAMLRVWDLENDFALVSEQAAHWYTINHIVFSPDGQLFATASRDKTFKIWDTTTVTPLKTVNTIRFGGHINSVNRLLWLEDYLLSCSDDRTMMIWKVQ